MQGLTAQLMRHNEASQRNSLGAVEKLLSHYQSVNEELRERIRELEHRELKVAKMTEEYASLEHERHIVMERERQTVRREEFVKEKLNLLTPVLVSKMFGKGSKADPIFGEEIVRQFFKSLRPEQFDRLMSLLDPEQIAAAGALYEGYGQQEIKREEAAKKAEPKPPSHDGA